MIKKVTPTLCDALRPALYTRWVTVRSNNTAAGWSKFLPRERKYESDISLRSDPARHETTSRKSLFTELASHMVFHQRERYIFLNM